MQIRDAFKNRESAVVFQLQERAQCPNGRQRSRHPHGARRKPARFEWRLRTEQNLDAPSVPMTVIGSPRGEAWVTCYGGSTSASALAEDVLKDLSVDERLQAIDVSLEIDALRGRAPAKVREVAALASCEAAEDEPVVSNARER